MFLQNLRAKMSARLKGEGEAGFTLIELLVVMLILGILAAIAIPAFFNQRDKGTDAQAKAAVRTAQTALETWATDNGGRYVKSDGTTKPTAGELQAIEPTLNDATLAIPNATTNSYTVQVTSDTTNVFKIIRDSDGTVDLECTTAGTDGCPADTDSDSEGNWGG